MSVTEKTANGNIQPLSELTKQGEKGGESGCLILQAIDQLEDQAKGWGDSQQRRFWVLDALMELSRDHPNKAEVGFTALELWEKVNTTQKWMPFQKDPSTIAKGVRGEIAKLKTANLEHQEPLAKASLDRGFNWWPVIEADVGGGSSNPTRYRIEARPISDMTRAAVSRRAVAAPDEVQYEIDLSMRLGFYLRWIEKGLKLTGVTRRIFIGLGALLVVSVLGLAGVVGLTVIFGSQPKSAVFALAAYIWLIYTELLPPYRVISARILKAPTLIQGADDGLLLEWRGKPRYPASELHVVRYLGICPLCSGAVNVNKRHWWGTADDLVGRCENAPRQHLFTFDHELKIGVRIPTNI